MIKTTMAEAVRERPRATKTKPKKPKEKKATVESERKDTVPVPITTTPDSCRQQEVISQSKDDTQQVLAQPSSQTEDPPVLAETGEFSTLATGDSEAEKGQSHPAEDFTALSSQLQENLTLQDAGGEACPAEMLPTATSDESASESNQEAGAAAEADESVIRGEQSAQSLPTALPDSSDVVLTSEAAESNVNDENVVDSLSHGSSAVATEVFLPATAGQMQPEMAAVEPHTAEPFLVSTVTEATAPQPSLESVPSLDAKSQERLSNAPTTLPLASHLHPPVEAMPPPSQPGTVPAVAETISAAVKVSGPAERLSSPEAMSPTHQHLYPKVPLLESPQEARFQPMSVEELQQLYYNPELMANDRFVDDFVQKEEKKTSHEFHEIVMNYFRSRKSLLSVEEDLKLLRQNYDQIQSEIWILHKRNITVEGQCKDGSRVSKVHSYEQCELNRDALTNLASTLRSIQSEMQGDLALFAYSSQMSKLQVESYLHQLFTGCPHLRDMPRNAPVTAMDHTKEELLPQVEKLKDCISVLFGFHRKPTKDAEFVDNIRKWTERLVAALLRVASYGDHLFLLNHILRSPAGVGRWATGFVQVPGPASLALQTTLGSPVLDHAVTCLATVLLPVRAREEFMCQMRINVTEQSLQLEQAWTLVDSDGEEDEDPSQAWLYLHENDVVSILQQFPLDAIFAHLLQAPVDESGTVHYDVRRCTEPTMMKLFAFCTTWISLLGAGLHTYSMARYRQLNKRLGRLIRQTMAFVSDHWLNFKTYYGPLASTSSLDHLQLEFDQLFMRATYTILTAQKLGSWQFMADMPFTCLSSGSVWRLLWLLQQGQGQPNDLHTLPPVEKCKEDMKDIESRRQLADALQNLPTSESIYLLTTFANMATARPLEEDEFIECITLQVFEIAYICDHTRDICSKTGRELLSSIIQKHPTALSMLLRRIQGVMAELGNMSLYLFSELPASIWTPQDPDMVLLRQWLLNNDLGTPENQLARVVLDRMNWDLFAETGKLVLDIRLHRQVALLLIESYVKFISERRASFFIIEGMKQMASYAYTTQQGSREQQFNNWAWALALRLKLHREAAILHSRAAESHPFQPPKLEEEQWLIPLASAARAKNPLACFLVLSMTDVGHDINQFMAAGVDMLQTLATSCQYSAVIHILSCIVPQFLSTPEYLLQNEVFQKILQMVLSADESVLKVTKMAMGAEFKAGTITQQFTQMIQAMISSHLENNAALPTLLFWIQALFKVANFLSDLNCCFVLDHLVRWAYLQKGARDKLDEVFRSYHKQLLSESKNRGGFLTWVAGSQPNVPSLMERSSMPEFGWLAMVVLSIEDSLDQECGVWPSVQLELLANPSVSLETAMKHVLARLKPDHPRSVTRLSIYRWAQQAIDMPINHPMMPLVWQRFFSLFLGRCAQQAQLPARASVGERFFQSMSMSSMLKKLKKKLAEAAEYHLKYDPHTDINRKKTESVPQPSHLSRGGSETDTPLPSPVTEESPQYFSSKEFHNQLAKLYQTLSLWLEEPRLHGADLYLPALPPQYEAARLMHVFTPGNTPWLEFVDFEGAQYDISLFAAEWRKMVSGRPQFGSYSPAHRRNTMLPGNRTATERILQRLQRYSSPKGAPSLQAINAPVPDISPSLLMDKMAAIHLLDSDLSVLSEFTKFFSNRAAQQCAIDGAFLDLIPEQYRNVTKQAKVTAECRRLVPLHSCAGPAVLSVRIEERELNSIVQRKMDENRAEYKQLVIEAVLPPPQNICIAAVHVENAITMLIKLSQSMTDPGRRAVLNDVACTLFFHLTVQVCEETNFYPPTKQFFTSCVEILGQEFVSRTPAQTPLLLQFSLDNPGLAGMVASHFVPNNCPQNFVTMYGQLITVLQQQNMDLVFMLLTKFDIRAWLEECRPHADDKKRLLETLGSALMSCGAEPGANTKLVFDLYLGHLRCILKHNFPTNLSSVLGLLLQGSSREELHTSCWEMLLAECCAASRGPEELPVAKAFSVQQVEACNDVPLSTEQLEEILRWLGAFFNHQRRSQPDLSSFGLYPRWGRYVPYVALLMGLMSRSFIAKVLVSLQDHNPRQALQVVWHQQLDLWQAWMEPLPPNLPQPAGAAAAAVVPQDLLQPWTEGDNMVAVTMVEAFKSTLLFMQATLNSTALQYSSTVFSLLLMHYLTKLSHRSTPPHVSQVLVAELSQMPWEQLKPDLQLLETMAVLKQHCAPTCFELLGHIMPKVGWAEVITLFKMHQEPHVAQRMQVALLLLLVQCYGDPAVRELPEISQMLMKAEMYDWVGLTADMYRTASFWFLQVCQPEWVLAQRSSLPALGFRFMKTAAEFTPATGQAWTREMSVKRLTYVHCVTQQLCQVSYQPKANLEAVSTVLVNLLSEIESVESAVGDTRSQEEESMDLMREVLGLLNNSNPEGESLQVLLQTLQQWLHSSPHSIMLTPCIKAASRCLASLAHVVRVTETCIQVYFTAYTKDNEAAANTTTPASTTPALGGWDHILAVFQVPELNMVQYVQEAVGSGSYLLLYALLLHRRPLCQSLGEEGKMMEEVLEWTSAVTPSAENEAKLLLWWLEFCRMWLHQLDSGVSPRACIIAAQRLVTQLHHLGEDRSSTGILGVIGFGKRSQLSLQFRLAVRSMAAFLSTQIMSETALRFQAAAPLSDLPMAKQCRSALTSLRGNKMYSSLKDSVESMIGFISRMDHTTRSVLDLIQELAATLYPDCDYLKASVKWAASQGDSH